MQIQYFGLSSFKLTSKDTSSIIDPFDKSSGLTPPRGNADVILLSQKENPTYSYTQSISGEPFMIDGPGQYDVKGHTVEGIPIKDKDGAYKTIYLIELEDVRMLFLAHIKELNLSQEELEDLGDIDILFVPVGGDEVMDFDAASKAVNLIEPKIVIPMHYEMSGLKMKVAGPEKFLKQLGGKHETMDKLSIKKKELVEENTKVIVLEPLR